MANKIKLKRGLHQNLPALDVGEPAFTTDTKDFYIGTDTGNKLLPSKVDDLTIKINESNQYYVNSIAQSKVSGLTSALNDKVGTDTNINGKALTTSIELTAADIVVTDITSKFDTMHLQGIVEQLDDEINGIVLPTVPEISVNILDDQASDVKTASPKAVKTYVDNKVSSTYKASGSLKPSEIVNSLLIAGNLGNVYNITGEFTTSADFVEGAGNKHPAGTNVVIVYTGTEYKFDVLAGFVDTSAFLTEVPVARSDAVGGIMASEKAIGQTVEVVIDPFTSKLYVPTYPTVVDTKNTAGTTNKAATKLFLVGAGTQATNPQTYSNSVVYIGTDNKLYSNGSVVLTAVPQATTAAFGGVKINYTTVTPKHKVELDENGNAFVNLTSLTIDGGEW